MARSTCLAALLLCLGISQAGAGDAVRFFDSVADARASTEEALPVVISFGAPWCGWCRKMTTETFGDKQVQDVADQYLWVKIDTDKNPELSARFGVRGIPHTALLDGQGRLLASQPGYMAPARFVKFVEERLKNPPMELAESAGELAAEFDREPTREQLLELVERLAQPERSDRKPLLEALGRHPLTSWPLLVELLSDKRLAIRAASAAALAHNNPNGPEFDPFAEAQRRQSQAKLWQQWVSDHLPEQPPAAGPEGGEPTPKPEQSPRPTPAEAEDPADDAPR